MEMLPRTHRHKSGATHVLTKWMRTSFLTFLHCCCGGEPTVMSSAFLESFGPGPLIAQPQPFVLMLIALSKPTMIVLVLLYLC
jgi:hypothetical protein